MSVVYAFAALENESQAVRNITGPNDVVLITSGMGPLNAKSKADVILGVKSGASAAGKPDAVLIIGLCGGLAASLPERRIVAYTGCLSTEATSPMLPCAAIITDSMVRLLACSDIPCDRVVGITSPRMATTPDERIALARSGAAAVDMESYSILGAAARVGVPAVVLRVVSDPFDRELPDFNRALNAAGGLDRRKALKVALGSPLSTAKLLAANRRAMQELRKALEIILKTDCFR